MMDGTNLLATVLTGSKGLYTKMNPHVLRQVRTIREGFDTVCTFVWLRFSHVHLTMYLVHFRFGIEALKQTENPLSAFLHIIIIIHRYDFITHIRHFDE